MLAAIQIEIAKTYSREGRRIPLRDLMAAMAHFKTFDGFCQAMGVESEVMSRRLKLARARGYSIPVLFNEPTD